MFQGSIWMSLVLFFSSLQASQAAPGASYRARYPLSTAAEKLVDNRGKGFEALYGVRNLRAVLNGVYYRGGANNMFLEKPRDNSNPLPAAGLKNLCEEGFGHAVYLYPTRFDTAEHEVRCKNIRGEENVLTYLQISPLAYREKDLRQLLSLINEHIRNPRLGPVYDHCWNGWHASGYVAATTLRQFCGFSAEAAVAYWNLNTDGNNGTSYEPLRKKIREFRPYSDLTLTAEEKAALCPKPGTLAFEKK